MFFKWQIIPSWHTSPLLPLSFPPEYLSGSNLLHNEDPESCLYYVLVTSSVCFAATCSENMDQILCTCMKYGRYSLEHLLQFYLIFHQTLHPYTSSLSLHCSVNIIPKHSSHHGYCSLSCFYHQALSPISKNTSAIFSLCAPLPPSFYLSWIRAICF